MRKVLRLLDALLSYSIFYKLIKYRIKYKGARISPTVKFLEQGGDFSYITGNSIGDHCIIIKTAGSFISLGARAWLGNGVYLEPSKGTTILIQAGASIQDRCRLLGDIAIGKNVLLAPNVYMSSGNHFFNTYPALPIRFQDEMVAKDESMQYLRSKKVVVEDDCWIGTNVVIMQGVTIGKGCIIGANAVVTKDIPPYSIAVGSPAKVVKKRLEFSPPQRIIANCSEHQPYFYEGCLPIKLRGDNVEDNIKVMLDKTFAVYLSDDSGSSQFVYLTFDCEQEVADLSLQYKNQLVPVRKGRNTAEWALNINSEYIPKFEFQFVGTIASLDNSSLPISIIEVGLK